MKCKDRALLREKCKDRALLREMKYKDLALKTPTVKISNPPATPHTCPNPRALQAAAEMHAPYTCMYLYIYL